MKKQLTFALLACAALASAQAQNTFEGQFTRPLGEVLQEISTRFNVRLAYDIDVHDIYEILGTIAGDDTIILVLREEATREALKQALSGIIPNI